MYSVNTGIFKNNGKWCGDILFKLENTPRNSFIMFEVKNCQKSSGTLGKDEIKKFFHDLNSTSNGDICGGVLISLNGPVDFNTLPLEPKFDLESGKPYIYIDCMKEQYPDAQCLMKVNFISKFEYLLLST